MSDKRWLLLKPDGDGNPLRWLTDQQIRELLADPSKWGVREFKHVDGLGAQYGTDPNYWPDGTGVLLRVEVVVPERGGWRLPADIDAETPGHWVTGSTTEVKLGDLD